MIDDQYTLIEHTLWLLFVQLMYITTLIKQYTSEYTLIKQSNFKHKSFSWA